MTDAPQPELSEEQLAELERLLDGVASSHMAWSYLNRTTVGTLRALLAMARPSVPERAPTLTHPELEEAIKHVTAYDSAQIGMLDSTLLWRLIVAARHYIWMLHHVEARQGDVERLRVALNAVLPMAEFYVANNPVQNSPEWERIRKARAALSPPQGSVSS